MANWHARRDKCGGKRAKHFLYSLCKINCKLCCDCFISHYLGGRLSAWAAHLLVNWQLPALLMSWTHWLHMAAVWNSISSDKSLCFPSLATPAQIRLLQIQFQCKLYFPSFLEFRSCGCLPNAGNSLNFCQQKLKKKEALSPSLVPSRVSPLLCVHRYMLTARTGVSYLPVFRFFPLSF